MCRYVLNTMLSLFRELSPFILKTPYETGSAFSLILEMRKMGLGELNWPNSIEFQYVTPPPPLSE